MYILPVFAVAHAPLLAVPAFSDLTCPRCSLLYCPSLCFPYCVRVRCSAWSSLLRAPLLFCVVPSALPGRLGLVFLFQDRGVWLGSHPLLLHCCVFPFRLSLLGLAQPFPLALPPLPWLSMSFPCSFRQLAPPALPSSLSWPRYAFPFTLCRTSEAAAAFLWLCPALGFPPSALHYSWGLAGE